MTWFNVVVVLVVILVGWLESIRGFGRALFDFVGAIISVKMATFLAPHLAVAAPILPAPASAEAAWIAIVFVTLAILTVIATKFIYDTTLLSLDVLDPVVGSILGIATGVLVSHVFLRVLLAAYAGTEFADVVNNSFAGQELIHLRFYHQVVTSLQEIGKW